MSRLRTARYLAAMLWLLAALMPGRALAVTWMQASLPVQQAAAIHEMATADQALPPCHTMAADPAADTDNAGRGTCTACDLCHSGVVPVAAVAFAAARLHSDPPQEASCTPHARPSPDGLFRPPR
jgi:hypothetical protein